MYYVVLHYNKMKCGCLANTKIIDLIYKRNFKLF